MLSADLYVCTVVYGLASVYVCNTLSGSEVLLPVGLYAGMFHVARVSVNACGVLGHGAGVAPSPAPRRLRGVLPAQTPSEPLSAVALAWSNLVDQGLGPKKQHSYVSQ